jgi:hypothetical protein
MTNRMAGRTLLALAGACLSWLLMVPALAADLYPDGTLRDMARGHRIEAGDTMAGYPIYPGHNGWFFEDAKSDLAIGPNVVRLGTVRMTMTTLAGSTIVAVHNMSANLAPSFSSAGWTGGPCRLTHNFMKTGRNGTAETCLYIDVVNISLGNRSVLFFMISANQAGMRGNYLHSVVGLNGEIFGFRDMVPGDWNEAALKAHPRRKAFFDRLTQWALQFEQAVDKAFRKEAGVDAYADLPSYMTLAPVIEDLRDESPSLTFLGAVADLSNKPDHSAIAYSPTGKGTTRWGNSWGLPTPADAQERALAACERERPSSAPPCKVYMGKRLP